MLPDVLISEILISLPVLSVIDSVLLQGQLFTFSAVVVLVAALVFGLPLTKRHHEHAKGLVLGPEPVLDAGTNEELIVGIGMMDLPIELQMGAVIKEMEKLISDLV